MPGGGAVGVRDSLGGGAPEEDARLVAEDRRHEVVIGLIAHVELDARLERGDLDESGATAAPGFVGWGHGRCLGSVRSPSTERTGPMRKARPASVPASRRTNTTLSVLEHTEILTRSV